MTAADRTRSSDKQSLVALHFPEGRELLWTNRHSPLFAWEVGEPVVYRNASWIVVDRTENEIDDSITLRLRAA
jgi:hypothetical protein